ncbi:heme anaerobic degradation radical SAM methyltransferase ChuW/HutW [Aeromonas salmonicida]|uniref:Heme anaerobic degradation radical SAM methyltransferase ChuW/HutW n=1 Tax=Escherichia coli TaxID=562 RepID=A0A3L0VVU5_ECOLX|nr:heme anaerobic degradation radical SAM methyltransferase ChuW/HutW [Aeromonas salmonicida]MDR6993554.1 oxygen-independent coproporphyrinogen-3 oxidase [Aeromonas salmonicida]HEH9413163.1 heme anaerobic degradation radical SAM methyltransferase ChuW/HutW [Aeromonas salmonicida]HEH9422170.1 heme anaerobic degradation radical SAM methyltransferase ChuW/HutW [Aeromonas salmonicida]HEH9435229.1 heme anaerobic degradation radical SAM methyltransferase ChuW/HutW [Aeromonas salmonicida]
MTLHLTPTMTGLSTPDPLKFAFSAKTSAHASRGGIRPFSLDDAGWQAWWQQRSQADERALYIHVPFCRKRCSFCNFFENGANPARMSRYMAALCDSLIRAADTPLAQSRSFSAVYVGGGTPTDMAVEDLAQLGRAIQRFPLTLDAEVTLEGRLNGFDDAKWQTALAGGFNRFSFGVQSFDTRVRQQAARFDDRQTLLARLGELTQDDAAVIVADLIFGLPGQDDEVWRQDIADVMASGVHGVDLYQLIPMAGTNLERAEASGKLGWAADGQQRAAMYAYGAQTLEQGGWQRLSCSHWRRGDAEQSRYNQMAKRGAEILPFGAGAGGNVHGHGLMYGRDLALWHEALAGGVRAPGMVMGQNPNALTDGLLRGALDSGRLALERLPAPLRAHLLPLFQAWQLHGLAALTEDKLVLTLAGRFWNVNLQAGLFEFLQLNPLGGVQSAVHSTEAVRHSLV